MPGRWPDQTLDQAFGLPEGSGRRPPLASVLQEGRENAIIAAGLGFIWRISVNAYCAGAAAGLTILNGIFGKSGSSSNLTKVLNVTRTYDSTVTQTIKIPGSM